MVAIRKHAVSKILAVLMGIAFLNMGFFLSEVRMLDLDNSPLVENIAKLVSTIGCEEEKDGLESSATDSPSPTVDFYVTLHAHGSNHRFLIATIFTNLVSLISSLLLPERSHTSSLDRLNSLFNSAW
jgi:hypothetical protein